MLITLNVVDWHQGVQTMSIASRVGLAENALAGRVALVTGAASGIGWATTRLLIHLGAVVVAIDRDAATLSTRRELASDAGGRLYEVVFDLSHLDGVDDLARRVCAECGPVTILVNAAGITGKTVLTTSLEDWQRVLAVDLTAPFLLLQAASASAAASTPASNGAPLITDPDISGASPSSSCPGCPASLAVLRPR
jgi:NAD(P)-dependent dehydrogenase (short-subunit alcohol dehydrogenase family)